VGDEFDDFDPEELAEDTATRAFQRVLIGKTGPRPPRDTPEV